MGSTSTSLVFACTMFLLNTVPAIVADTMICKDNMNLVASKDVSFLNSPTPESGNPPPTRCTVQISSGSADSIVYVSVDFLKLDNDSTCNEDYLDLYDGTVPSQAPFKPDRELCGNTTYATFKSTGQNLGIIFSTDGLKSSDGGFKLRYYSRVKGNQPTTPCNNNSLVATEKEQYITSPGYPDWYPSNSDCIWKITADSSSKVIVLESEDEFILEQSLPLCQQDYLRITDDSTASSPQTRLMCDYDESNDDANKEIYKSKTQAINVVFHSDGLNNYYGFNISYKSVNSSPGNIYRDTGSTLTIVVFTMVYALVHQISSQ